MDSISDLLIRIKNAQRSGHQRLEVPFSKQKLEIAKILHREGFIKSIEKRGAKTKERLEIYLKYEQGEPAIRDLRRISKPAQRIYKRVGEIKPVKQGYAIAIISTSQGLMTDKEARKKRLGGEVFCEVW